MSYTTSSSILSILLDKKKIDVQPISPSRGREIISVNDIGQSHSPTWKEGKHKATNDYNISELLSHSDLDQQLKLRVDQAIVSAFAFINYSEFFFSL